MRVHPFSEVHAACVNGTKGMPSAFISFELLNQTFSNMLAAQTTAQGGAPTFPYAPPQSSSNIILPASPPWAYSVFPQRLTLSFSSSTAAVMDAEVWFSIHLINQPDQVVKWYKFTIDQQPVEVGFKQSSTIAIWKNSDPTVVPAWTSSFDETLDAAGASKADGVLKGVGWIDSGGNADRARFQLEVDVPIRWINKTRLVDTAINYFSSINLGKLIPWVRFENLSSAIYTNRYIIFWSENVSLFIPGCTDQNVVIPAPVGYVPPAIPASSPSQYHFGVFATQSILSILATNKVGQEVLTHGDGGGVIKWSYDGRVHMNSGMPCGVGGGRVVVDSRRNPGSADVNAFVDSPCGRVDGPGTSLSFDYMISAILEFKSNSSSRTVDSILGTVNSNTSNTSLANKPYPLDHVAGDLFHYLTYVGDNDLGRSVVNKWGSWKVVGDPLPTVRPDWNWDPVMDILDGESVVIGLYVRDRNLETT